MQLVNIGYLFHICNSNLQKQIHAIKLQVSYRSYAGGVSASRLPIIISCTRARTPFSVEMFLVRMATFECSKYFSELKDEAKARYEDKMKIVECAKDPYCYLESEENSTDVIEWTDWPDTMYPDVYNYLVHTVSLYTGEEMRAYKSLDGYNFLVNGWLNSITVLATGTRPARNYVFLSSVKHSQSLSLMSLKVWVATKENGEVLCGHCTCMAGLGEACSHITAVLFAAEANTLTKRQLTSTSLPCSWLPPTFRNVKFDEICNIDFTTPQHKWKSSDNGEQSVSCKKSKLEIPMPTEEDLRNHHFKLSTMKGKPILLSFVSEFNVSYVPKYISGELPVLLTHLYDKTTLSLSFPDLLNKCDELYYSISHSVQQVSKVEEDTRQQANSKVWFEQRAGRVTASKLHSVLHTKLSNPSVSLIKSICYPQKVKFSSEACAYGCRHENEARSSYCTAMKEKHSNFTVKASGLLLDPASPFLGASPDGIVECNCCGSGVLEIKCPYSCKEISFEVRVDEQSFFLEEDDNGNLHLKEESHPYYYQVQLQMKLYGACYYDFVVWKKDEIFIQRISYNVTFISEALDKIVPFIKYCILPELVGKWFTRPTQVSVDSSDSQPDVVNDSLSGPSDVTVQTTEVHDNDSETVSNTPISTVGPDKDIGSEDDTLWCYCQRNVQEELVGCDNPTCKIQWFHLSCLQLTVSQLPKGKWYCPDCHKERYQAKGKGKGKAKQKKYY